MADCGRRYAEGFGDPLAGDAAFDDSQVGDNGSRTRELSRTPMAVEIRWIDADLLTDGFDEFSELSAVGFAWGSCMGGVVKELIERSIVW